MNVKHLLWSLTAASLLAPASVGAVRTEDAQHATNTGATTRRLSLPPSAGRPSAFRISMRR